MIYIKTWREYIKPHGYLSYKGAFLFGFIPLWIRWYFKRDNASLND